MVRTHKQIGERMIKEKYAKQREENKNKKLLFLGTAQSCFEVNYDDYDEIWGAGAVFGECNGDVKKIDLGFEIHPMDQMLIIAKERNVDYNKFNCPILVQKSNNPITRQLIEKPIDFPLDDMLEYVKEMNSSIYFTSTFCYMIVYATMMGYKDITLFKILLTSDLEYNLERPGIEYWIDLLGHKEVIDFKFPEDAEMWSQDILYGFEQRPNLWKMESRKKNLWGNLVKHFIDCENTNSLLNRCSGMLEMYHVLNNTEDKENINKVIDECRNTIQNNSDRFKSSRERYMQFLGALQTTQFIEERGY